MAVSANIDERTDLFIREYWRLKNASELPDNKVIAHKIGINSASTLSNILARRQNIKAGAWKSFQGLYMTNKIKNTSEDIPNTSGQEIGKEPSAMQILSVLAEALKAQSEIMKSIENKMAQRDSQAIIEGKVKEVGELTDKLGARVTLVLETLRTVAARQEADEYTILRSLERIEQLPETKLLEDAGKRRSQIEELAKKFGNQTA